MDPKNFIQVGLSFPYYPSHTPQETWMLTAWSMKTLVNAWMGVGNHIVANLVKCKQFRVPGHAVGKFISIPLFDHHWYIPLHI
jgi:hypothetical protein